jgi:hypothetical protein
MRPGFCVLLTFGLAAILLVGTGRPLVARRRPRPNNVPAVVRFDAAGILPLAALAKLSAQAGVPMGVEWVGPGEGTPITRTWRDVSVGLIAEQILSSQNGKSACHGRWDHGTLVLRPAARRLGAHSVLDIRLPSFGVCGERPVVASRLLADAVHRDLFGQSSRKAFTWSGGFNLGVPDVAVTRSFRNDPVYRVLDWLAAAGAESFWSVEDLPYCHIGGTKRWCTYTYFGAFRRPVRQPLWAPIPWRTEPMDTADPASVQKWRCAKCPPSPKPPGR